MFTTDPAPQTGRFSASVIVVCYNQLPTMHLCLESLSRQSTKELFEVIICDDGSDISCTEGIIKSATAYPIPVKYVWQQDRDYRSTQAKNNGVRIASGNILIFLDGDMVPESNFVEKHLQAHTGGQFVVAGDRVWRSDEGIDWNWEFEAIVSNLRVQVPTDVKMRARSDKEHAARQSVLDGPISDHWKACAGCNMSVPRGPYSYYDENFYGWGPDDWELALRLQKRHGHQVKYDESIRAYQVERAELFFNVFRTLAPIGVARYVRNIVYFSRKYPELNLLEHFRFAFARLRYDKARKSWTVAENTDFSLVGELIQEAVVWADTFDPRIQPISG